MKPLLWMRALRGTGAPPAALAVLWALALRMDKTGAGWVSMEQLAIDASMHRATASRHVQWAISAGWLERTRRGHRITGKTAVASEYVLTQPNVALCDVGSPDPTSHLADPTSQSADPTSPRGDAKRSSPRGPHIKSAAPMPPATPSRTNGTTTSPMNDLDLKKITNRVDRRVDIDAERRRQTAALAAWQQEQERIEGTNQ